MTPETSRLASELLPLARNVAQAAGQLLMQRPAHFDLTEKSVAIDFATQMDEKAEALIVEGILAARPDDGIIGEEGAARESRSGITWVIDPLDGTVNYFYGLPGWNVSVAARDDEGSLVGVVYAPTINSLWHAVRGGGAFHNGQKIRATSGVSLDRALIGTGFAYDVAHRTEQIAMVASLLPRVRDIRRMGSAAVDLCHVGMGSLDAYFERGLHEWDWAAGALVATEAGGQVAHLVRIGDGDGSRKLTVAAGPGLFDSLQEALARVEL
jgi:myo-inositol-1(or 4)-monophosphatase